MMIFSNGVPKIKVLILVVVAINTEAAHQKNLNAQAISLKTSASKNDVSQIRVLFDSSNQDENSQWQTVNDVVMGGRSDGRFRIMKDGMLEFYGILSLENNGGFASVRSKPRNLKLQKGDTILARVKGDGRQYTLNLYVTQQRVAFSYRVTFQTEKGKWIELRVPLQNFVATSFGRVVTNAGPVNPKQVNSIGFLLGDKKAGPFKLEVDWIKAGVFPAEKE